MARQSAVSKDAREYIKEQIKERGLVTVEEVTDLVFSKYCFDAKQARIREVNNYSRRLLASIKDQNGVRTVLAVKGSPGLFADITTCRSIPVLDQIDRQLTEKIEGTIKPRNMVRKRKSELLGQYSLFESATVNDTQSVNA